jgi:hypothetical protein
MQTYYSSRNSPPVRRQERCQRRSVSGGRGEKQICSTAQPVRRGLSYPPPTALQEPKVAALQYEYESLTSRVASLRFLKCVFNRHFLQGLFAIESISANPHAPIHAQLLRTNSSAALLRRGTVADLKSDGAKPRRHPSLLPVMSGSALLTLSEEYSSPLSSRALYRRTAMTKFLSETFDNLTSPCLAIAASVTFCPSPVSPLDLGFGTSKQLPSLGLTPTDPGTTCLGSSIARAHHSWLDMGYANRIQRRKVSVLCLTDTIAAVHTPHLEANILRKPDRELKGWNLAFNELSELLST